MAHNLLYIFLPSVGHPNTLSPLRCCSYDNNDTHCWDSYLAAMLSTCYHFFSLEQLIPGIYGFHCTPLLLEVIVARSNYNGTQVFHKCFSKLKTPREITLKGLCSLTLWLPLRTVSIRCHQSQRSVYRHTYARLVAHSLVTL